MTVDEASRRRTYVLDTSVLLADPRAPLRFEGHDVVVPVVAILELEAKRNHPDLGWNARKALGFFEELRQLHGGLDELLPLGGGSTLRIEPNHADVELPDALATFNHDHRVLAVCIGLLDEHEDVQLVSKDLPLRLKAGVLGIEADEYRSELATSPVPAGFGTVEVAGRVVDTLFHQGVVDLDEARDMPCNAGVALLAGSQSALGRVKEDKRVHLVRERSAFEVRPRSAEQRVALDLLLDTELGVVSLGGPAGTGKSLLAMAAGIQQTLETRQYRRVLVFRPLHAVGGQDLGFLPGTEDEKMHPWTAAVTDALSAIASQSVIDELHRRRMIEVLPLTHIRGRTLTDAFVIIDEAQNLERSVLLTALSRLGQNSKAVLTHDINQRDNLRIGRHDGIVSVIEALSGHPLFGHITLTRSERSVIAAVVTRLLDEI
ncbi:MAG: PhoH family protein [Acidimicrobiales bacterium]